MFHQIDYSWFKKLIPTDVPATFLWGEKDWILKPSEINELKKIFPCHSKMIIPGWDHFPMIDQPESYAFEVTKIATDLTVKSHVSK